MLRLKFLIFEWILVGYLVLQTLFPKQLTIIPAVSGFALLSSVKYHFEGLRLVYAVILINQILLALIDSIYVRVILIGLTILALSYFPVYRYPEPTGKYSVGYRRILLPGISSVGIYYPTDEKTRDVKYSPSHLAWERFADLVKFFAEILKQRPLPKFLFKLGLSFLEHQYIGVNENARLLKPEGESLPVVVLSHGLSANIHIYSIHTKEWASRGFITFSVDHDEEIYLNTSRFSTVEDYFKVRNQQLQTRKRVVTQVMDLISDPVKVKKIFDDENVSLNYNKLFVAGHSFGGATVSEVVVEDKRVTGGVVLLDPWFESNDERILYQPANKPILSLRSNEYENMQSVRIKTVKHAEINNQNKGLVLSGYFKDSSHNTPTDLGVLMKRELVLFKMLKSASDVEDQIKNHLLMTRLFLEKTLKYDGKLIEGQTVQAALLEQFRVESKKIGLDYTFISDN